MTSKSHALIIDDEPDLRQLLEITLGRMNIETKSASCCAEAKDLLKNHHFDLCLTDMRLPDGNGLDLLNFIQQHFSKMPVAIITAHGTMETAIQALKDGAFDFVTKPVELNVLRNLVTTALALSQHSSPSPQLKLFGKSKVILQLTEKILKLARSQAPIYISGPSGSGKELVARLIHESGARVNMPFIPVNCGAIPRELMESEFFGHKKGSFTGAIHDKAGLFQAADGGTLFLDEIGELPVDMQVKLLRCIQEKSVRPVGSTHEIQVDIRILSATNHKLQTLIEQGLFREDLFYRINVIEIQVPPLCERLEDIDLLADHILENLAKNNKISKPDLPQESLARLKSYSFPGNVRELENILERATTLCENDLITPGDLQLPSHQANTEEAKSFSLGKEDLGSYMDNIEKEAILKALEENNWNKSKTAEILGVSVRTLQYRLKKLELD
jgi:two-component system, NtrC family, response regulator PilR